MEQEQHIKNSFGNTNKIFYKILGSSSKGNAIIIENFLMLDAGVNYSKIKPYLKKIKLIFISHVHQDHLLPSAIKKIAYNYPTIKYVTGSEFVVEKLVECGVNKKNIYVLKSGKKYDLGLVKVKLEELYHDTTNYALKWEYKGFKGIYAVDTNKIDHIQAKKYDLYLIESNYNEELLGKHIKECIENNDSEDKLYYLQRVSKTHLSDKKCNDFLIENMGNNSIYEKIHKSNYNYEEVN